MRRGLGRRPAGKGSQPKAARVSKFEDAFSGDVDDARPAVGHARAEAGRAKAGDRAAEPAGQACQRRLKAPEKSTARAATALRLAQNLEKSGKTATALKSYKQIVKDYPGTPQARTAAERIKALEAGNHCRDFALGGGRGLGDLVSRGPIRISRPMLVVQISQSSRFQPTMMPEASSRSNICST